MRLLRTDLTLKDVQPKIKELVNTLYKRVPAGVGATAFAEKEGILKLTQQQFKEVAETGANWTVKQGYGWEKDLKHIESFGWMEGADSSKISQKAISRGMHQVGTLGSGNHYLEIQHIKKENIYDEHVAKKLGLFPDQIVIMFHCLPGNARVLTEHGYWIEIEKLEEKWKSTEVKCMDVDLHNLENASVAKFFKLKPCSKIFKIRTKTGKELTGTEEHPVLTPSGLKLMSELKEGNRVAVMPFEGVKYEEPSDETIVSEEDIRTIENNERIIRKLKKQGLLPLKLNSPKLPILVKLLGFLTGDGWLGKAKDRWSLKFIGKPQDLQHIRKDIAKLGYRATDAYSEYCKSDVVYTDGSKRTISGTTNTIVVGSLSLPILLYALGAPFGNKSKTEFEVPVWIMKAPLWIKRLYLAGYFGAEMTRPCIRKKEKFRFGNPTVSTNKLKELKSNGVKFLLQIKTMIEDFGVEVIKITTHTGVVTKSGEHTIKLRLKLSSKEESLKKLWSNIGFEYCQDRVVLSCYALQYLHMKERLLEQESILTGLPKSRLAVTSFNFRSVPYPTFEEFKQEYKLNPPTPIIWDPIESKKEVKDFDGYVYDITVNHKDHNFVANSFVTGNCGSRGFGHQIATDYISKFMGVMEPKYKIKVRDPELVCAPFQSPEGQDYFSAMKCAVNMAFANRQMILHEIRKSFEGVFGQSSESMGLDLIYDVAHNIAKIEKHRIDGQKKELIVHRKGATRSFGPEREELAPIFKEVGQPVIVGGSMETGSFLCVGTEKAEETFGSTMHGSGRTMSRGQARREFRGENLQKDMEKRGIYVKSVSMSGLAEEAGSAYKDINEVVETMHQAGISRKVVQLLPIGNVKG